jgi:hypothetical protein
MPDNDIKHVATASSFLNRLHGLQCSDDFPHNNISTSTVSVSTVFDPTSKNSFYNSLMSIDLRMSEGFCVHTRSNMIN